MRSSPGHRERHRVRGEAQARRRRGGSPCERLLDSRRRALCKRLGDCCLSGEAATGDLAFATGDVLIGQQSSGPFTRRRARCGVRSRRRHAITPTDADSRVLTVESDRAPMRSSGSIRPSAHRANSVVASTAAGRGLERLPLCRGPDKHQPLPTVVRCRERRQDVAPRVCEGLVYEHPQRYLLVRDLRTGAHRSAPLPGPGAPQRCDQGAAGTDEVPDTMHELRRSLPAELVVVASTHPLAGQRLAVEKYRSVGSRLPPG